jgi:uncharacterized protein YdeI (BOF family)
MVKKILIGLLVTTLAVAIGTSIYNASANPQLQSLDVSQASRSMEQGNEQDQGLQSTNVPGNPQAAAGQSRGLNSEPGSENERGGWRTNGQAAQSAGHNGENRGTANEQVSVAAPQNGLNEWLTLNGVISEVALPGFTLLADDGQVILVELGNPNYISSLGLTLQDGDRVSVTGFWDANGGFSLGSLTLETTGQQFTFRDASGRPVWAGGKGHGQGGQP